MNTNHKLGAVREIALVGRLLRGTIIATAVFALAFIVAPYIIAEANAANDVSSTISWSAIDLTLDPDVVATQGGESPDLATHGNVEFGDIVPTAKNATAGDYGTLKVQRKTIGVTTRGKYYTVFLSMEGSDQNLNLTYNNTTDTNIKIAKTSGTWTTPVTLATNGTSGWGYMVPGSVISGGFSSLTQTGMRDIFTASKLDTALYQTDGEVYTESIWAAVPVVTAPQQIWKKSTDSAGGFSGQDTFDVYYAVNVDTDVLSGTYQNRVVYTALASAASLDNVSYNLARTLKYGTKNETETLYFDLAQIGTPVTEGKLRVKMVPHSAMVTASFNPATVDMTGALTCGIVENSFTTVTTTDGNASTSKVDCTLPVGTVAPATASGTGAYDFVLEIDGFGYKYVSKINDGAEPGFVYAGLQSKDASGNKYVQNMQDMTAGVCENTNRWDNGLGTAAKLYTPTASTATADTGTQIQTVANGGILPNNFATTTTADEVGSFALKDTRDGKRYVVRRLADGNCWMAQNLNLDLYTGMTLTNEDTNLTTRDSWVLTDAAGSNNEATMASNKSWGDLAWVPNAGSTSRAWQTTHGVETVTLTKYTYDGSEWQSSAVAECTGGTQQAPCYATATSVKYYRASDDVEATPAVALADGYKQDTTGSPWRGFSNGAYYATVTYQLKKVNANTSGSWSAVNEGTTCTFSYFWNHLKSGEACVLTTTGDTMLTQFSAGNSTIGLNSTEVPRMAITLDHTGTYTAPVDTKTQATYTGANTISFMNNTNSRTTMVASDANWTQYPMSGSAADYRWELNGRDGVHVLDAGPVYYNVTQTSPTTAPASYGGNNNCASIGTTQGTLKLNGNTLNFVSCLTGGSGSDSTLALADTRVDGNWYNWYAAVAGSSISNFGNSGNDYYNAPDSICPKGWELPKDVGDDEISAGTLIDPSFYTLVTTNTSRLANFLGIDQAIAAKKTYNIPNNTDTGTITDYKLHAFPLSYVRSGNYYWNSGGLYYRGGSGYYWSAATYATDASRHLIFYSTYLSPRSGNNKGYGFAVRCVAAQ